MFHNTQLKTPDGEKNPKRKSPSASGEGNTKPGSHIHPPAGAYPGCIHLLKLWGGKCPLLWTPSLFSGGFQGAVSSSRRGR